MVFSTVEGGEAGGSILSPILLSVSLKMSGLDLETKKIRISSPQKLQKLDHLAILGHSWGLVSSAPEGPHSQTAGSPRKINEIRFAAKVLGTTKVYGADKC